MRYVVLLVRRPGASGYEVFVCAGEASLEVPAARYVPRLKRVVNTEPIGEGEFELIVRLKAGPLHDRAIRAYKDFVILQGGAEASA